MSMGENNEGSEGMVIMVIISDSFTSPIPGPGLAPGLALALVPVLALAPGLALALVPELLLALAPGLALGDGTVPDTKADTTGVGAGTEAGIGVG